MKLCHHCRKRPAGKRLNGKKATLCGECAEKNRQRYYIRKGLPTPKPRIAVPLQKILDLVEKLPPMRLSAEDVFARRGAIS